MIVGLSMGNFVSCTLAAAPGRNAKGAKVVLPCGDIRQLFEPTTAADLMFEVPNHFVVNSASMHVGRRFSALSADEELEMGSVYVLLPMRRLNSVVTAADLGVLLITANSAVRRASGGKARVLPELGPAPAMSEVPRLNLEEIEDEMVGEFKARLCVSRSRKPMLETIVEEPR